MEIYQYLLKQKRGNQSDKKAFGNIAKNYKKQLEERDNSSRR